MLWLVAASYSAGTEHLLNRTNTLRPSAYAFQWSHRIAFGACRTCSSSRALPGYPVASTGTAEVLVHVPTVALLPLSSCPVEMPDASQLLLREKNAKTIHQRLNVTSLEHDAAKGSVRARQSPCRFLSAGDFLFALVSDRQRLPPGLFLLLLVTLFFVVHVLCGVLLLPLAFLDRCSGARRGVFPSALFLLALSTFAFLASCAGT
jgi:hypothetical protein